MPTISLCMIVKNEEEFLERCLQSVQGLVHEIIIIDTGSTDLTKEIARRFTDKVYDFAWVDDFSAARNESLKHATGDWILVLDADETIATKDHSTIRELLLQQSQPPVNGYVLIQRNYIKDVRDVQYVTASGMKVTGTTEHESGFIAPHDDVYAESKGTAGWFPTPIVRLFRNTRKARFRGLVHEDVSHSLGGKIVSTTIPIHHVGKLNPQSWKKKWELYEQLAEKKAAQEQDYYSYYELGRQYLENRKIDLAKQMFEKSIAFNNSFWVSWFNLGSIHLLQNNLLAARDCLLKAKELDPNAVAIYSNLGVVYIKLKQFSAALEMFTASLNLNSRQPNVFRNMARCYEEMGDAARARLAWEKAKELESALP
ncbi:glycosyltransferase [Candidatus Woesearchaeota archaeon]|nr:glycosyltransferase [Candidatus Woesearchaeota archaeon]